MPKGANGGFAEYAICPAVSTFDMPESIPLPGAAALYFPFHLAWLGLFDRAELQAGESVLIHAAAGGSGSAAIQLAKHAGARVFATAGTDEKVQLCRDLGADVAINYNDADFAEVVLAETGNRGVDVVFDNVGEAVMEKSMQCTVYNGRYLMMGFASNKVVADEPFIVPRRIALGNLKLCGVLLAYQAPEMAEMLKTAMGWNFATDRARRAGSCARSSSSCSRARSSPSSAGRSASTRSPPRSRRWRTARRSAARSSCSTPDAANARRCAAAGSTPDAQRSVPQYERPRPVLPKKSINNHVAGKVATKNTTTMMSSDFMQSSVVFEFSRRAPKARDRKR